MKKNRIIYMGTTSFSAYILEQLILNDYNVIEVVSQPDRKVGRKQELKATPVKEVALKYNLNCSTFENINENITYISDLNPDIIITCAFGQKVTTDILDIPKYKSINVHASILPKYRGGAPIHYAIMNGESYTGNTIMYMVDKLDAGDIISTSKVDIKIEDTTSDLFDKLMIDGANLLLETLPNIFAETIKPINQDESLVTYSYNISREDEYIDFNREVLKVYNHIRGLIEIPGPYAYINGKKIKFYKVEFSEEKSIPNQIIIDNDNYFKIGCIDGYIKVFEFQLEGKKRTNFKQYINGNKLDIIDKTMINEEVKDENRSK